MSLGQFRAGFDVIAIGISAARASPAFDQHTMAALSELVSCGGQEADAVLGSLHFARNANDHRRSYS